jgi:hypothetical protein
MEVVGQGFALPIEDVAIINNAINIYQAWLLEPKSRPTPLRDDRQTFFRAIFYHFSLLFLPRKPVSMVANTAPIVTALGVAPAIPGSQGTAANAALASATAVLQKHVDLCKTVLRVLVMFVRQQGSEMDEKTWVILLKILLGTSDSLLSTQLQSFPNMAQDLTEPLLRVPYYIIASVCRR